MTQLFYLNRGYRCYDVGKSYSNTEYVGAKREAPDGESTSPDLPGRWWDGIHKS